MNKIFVYGLLLGVLAATPLGAASDYIYDVGTLKPVDSRSTLKVGDRAPDFSLPSIAGPRIGPGDYRGRKKVVLSFVPAAWTPVCSDQWPGYNLVQDIFAAHDAVLLGIAVDNIPSLHAWVASMGGLWFPVLSDFWPHGEVSRCYGVLRTSGVAERAIFIIDKQGLIDYIDVHDINRRPPLEGIMRALERP